MAPEHLQPSVSQISLSSSTSQNEDWDRWAHESVSQPTSQNSVHFPGSGDTQEHTVLAGTSSKAKRTLSELLKLHAERGTDVNFTPEEADRVAEVLGQWVSLQRPAIQTQKLGAIFTSNVARATR